MSRPMIPFAKLKGTDIAAFGVLLIFAINVVLVVILQWYTSMSPRLAEENGMLEVSQQVILSITGALFAICYLGRAKEVPQLRSLLLVALVCTFLFRETDVLSPEAPAWLSYWLDEAGKKVMLAAVWMLAIHYVLRSNKRLIDLRNFAIDSVVVWLAASAFFFLLSWLFDRSYLVMTNKLFYEECAELVGYALVSVAAVECATKS